MSSIKCDLCYLAAASSDFCSGWIATAIGEIVAGILSIRKHNHLWKQLDRSLGWLNADQYRINRIMFELALWRLENAISIRYVIICVSIGLIKDINVVIKHYRCLLFSYLRKNTVSFSIVLIFVVDLYNFLKNNHKNCWSTAFIAWICLTHTTSNSSIHFTRNNKKKFIWTSLKDAKLIVPALFLEIPTTSTFGRRFLVNSTSRIYKYTPLELYHSFPLSFIASEKFIPLVTLFGR
jgi:hypothetical protein